MGISINSRLMNELDIQLSSFGTAVGQIQLNTIGSIVDARVTPFAARRA